ncbi:MAG: hypothetical protein ACFFD4_20135 [Candidatus Odinarchaeota archaeon]
MTAIKGVLQQAGITAGGLMIWISSFILPPVVASLFLSNPLDGDRSLLVPLMVTVCLMGAVMIFSLLKIRLGEKGWEIRPEYSRRMSSLFGGRLIIAHGHHFECERYAHHEIKWNAKTICSGCYGTATGLITALLFVMTYYLVITRSTMLPPIATSSFLAFSFLFLLFSQSRYLIPAFTGRRVDARYAFLAHAALPFAIALPLANSLALDSNLAVITALLLVFALVGVRLLNAGSEHGETCQECEQAQECSFRAVSDNRELIEESLLPLPRLNSIMDQKKEG